MARRAMYIDEAARKAFDRVARFHRGPHSRIGRLHDERTCHDDRDANRLL